MEQITTKNAYDTMMSTINYLNSNKKPMNSRNVEYSKPIIFVKEVSND